MTRHLVIWLLVGALAAPSAAAHGMELGTDSLGNREIGLEPLRPRQSGGQDDVSELARLLGAELAASPLETRLLDDAADGRLDEWSLPDAALVAGGVRDAATLTRYADQLRRWGAEARALNRPTDSARQRAAALLELMHARFMRHGYEIDATELTTLLDQGQFNCVSATVLFIALSTEAGLKVSAVELPTHAFCRVTADNETFDVEPTCRRWFEVIDDPEARAAVARRISGAAGDGSAVPRAVSQSQLLAVIYYNRGVDLIRRGDDGAAIGANLRAMSLDPQSATARGNLWVAVNNAAVGHCRDQRFAESAALIARARQVVPKHAALSANELYVYQQWAADLCRQQRFAEALNVLDAGLAKQPGNLVLSSRREEVQRRIKEGSVQSTGY